MAVQIFRLRNVPEDEAEEVRQLLAENQVDFYETPAGMWGISMPALWIKDESQKDKVKALLAEYQQQRQQTAQEQADLPPWWQVLQQNPSQFIAYILLAGLVVYFSVMPFFNLG